MADGFGAVTFDVYIRAPLGNASADYTVTHVPYGNVNYVFVGGMLPQTETLAIGLTDESAFGSLEALVSTQATLTVNSVTHANALLVSLRRTLVNPVQADAVFIIP